MVLGNSPIKIKPLIKELQSYPLRKVADELTYGFINGFHLHYSGPREHRESPNLKSAYEHKDELISKVKKEIELGRIAGPFNVLPLPNLQVSPVGIVPKSDGISWRLITHLSYPKSVGINDYIDPELCLDRKSTV